MTSRVALVSTLTIGDKITEVDTPNGEFYTVVKINPKSIVVDAGWEGDPLPLRLPIRSTDSVRVAV